MPDYDQLLDAEMKAFVERTNSYYPPETVTFTIDQQQFWRGYMPIVLLTHNIKYGLQQANYFLTGPTIVDKDYVEKVAALVEKGYR